MTLKKVTYNQYCDIERELESIDNLYDEFAPISVHAGLYLALERAGITVFSREQALKDAQTIVNRGWYK